MLRLEMVTILVRKINGRGGNVAYSITGTQDKTLI
jgi:hypothetical protein